MEPRQILSQLLGEPVTFSPLQQISKVGPMEPPLMRALRYALKYPEHTAAFKQAVNQLFDDNEPIRYLLLIALDLQDETLCNQYLEQAKKTSYKLLDDSGFKLTAEIDHLTHEINAMLNGTNKVFDSSAKKKYVKYTTPLIVDAVNQKKFHLDQLNELKRYFKIVKENSVIDQLQLSDNPLYLLFADIMQLPHRQVEGTYDQGLQNSFKKVLQYYLFKSHHPLADMAGKLMFTLLDANRLSDFTELMQGVFINNLQQLMLLKRILAFSYHLQDDGYQAWRRAFLQSVLPDDLLRLKKIYFDIAHQAQAQSSLFTAFYQDVLSVMREKGLDLDGKSAAGNSSLIVACMRYNIPLVDALVHDAAINVNHQATIVKAASHQAFLPQQKASFLGINKLKHQRHSVTAPALDLVQGPTALHFACGLDAIGRINDKPPTEPETLQALTGLLLQRSDLNCNPIYGEEQLTPYQIANQQHHYALKTLLGNDKRVNTKPITLEKTNETTKQRLTRYMSIANLKQHLSPTLAKHE